MTTPNIDMVTASLRSCTLQGADSLSSSPPLRELAEGFDESAELVTVELNSEVALPSNWQQYLDMRTGEVYYLNMETGIRTAEDPRSYDDDEDQPSSDCDEENLSDEDSGSSDDNGGDTSASTCLSSTSSSETSTEYPIRGCRGHVLVAAGCKSCFTYFMVPKRAHACQRCGGRLLHLPRNSNNFL